MDLSTWILRIAVAGFFVMIGAEKFRTTGPGAEWVAIFQKIGLGQWFRYFTGAFEIGGAILYVIPPTSLIGAALLSSAMIGAVVVHITILHSIGAIAIPLVLLFAVIAVALREPETRVPWR